MLRVRRRCCRPPRSPCARVQVYGALNVLGAVPWQINRRILSVVEQLYEDQTGYKHLKIPAKDSFDVPLPSQPLHAFRTTRTKGGGLSAGVREGDMPLQILANTYSRSLQHTTDACEHDVVYQPLTLTRGLRLLAQWSKPPRRVLYLYNRESSAARKHNAESHSLRADLEWKLGVRLDPADAAQLLRLPDLIQYLAC